MLVAPHPSHDNQNRLCAKSLQLYVTLCDPMDFSPPGSSVRGIPQARILERVAMSSSGDLPHQGSNLTLLPPALAIGSLPVAPPNVLRGGKVNQIEDD